MRCGHFDAGRCRSCSLLATPYDLQLARKERDVRELLEPVAPDAAWLPPVPSPEAGFRNKAKMVVSGTVDEPVLGILGPTGDGVDLRDCPLHTAGLVAALPVLAGFVTRAALAPYDIGARRGELKHLIVTESPDGELMVRFVLRSQEPVARIRKHLPSLLVELPAAAVVSVNLQPEHKAVLEGEREILLHGETLTMRLNGLPLHLRPQGFFQTNTVVAEALYAQAEAWIGAAAPTDVLDLYCGVGGFALHAARALPGARVHGVEISAEAVAGARRTAQEAGLDHVTFAAGDATDGSGPAIAPGALVVVNPPRRGIGPDLARRLDESAATEVVYSSCNALTLARDLAAMPGLRAVEVRLLDMFPHTGHYEAIAHLTRR